MRAWFIAGSCLVLAACTLGDDVGPLEVTPGSWDGSVPETCVDGTRNGSESDVDCGGDACSRCGLAGKCGGDGDCASGYCAGGACAAPSCGDAVKDGAETDVDCGGGACPPCKDGKACVTAAHCESKSCIEGVCATPSCSDGVQNGAESFVDCGAGCPCDAGLPCAGDIDCKSVICSGGLCSPSSCTDGVTNGTESDVDCGGACPLCAPLQSCATAADCASGVCTTSKCQAPTCGDGVKNGAEADADCGTACGKPCADGKSCAISADCTSDVCLAGLCVPATCGDGIQNGGETLVDCGGGCPCDAGLPCTTGPGCKSGVCASMVCQVPACGDGVKNGAETDKDCGGTCPACVNGKACAANGDCQSQVCTAGTCKTPTCADATRNGAETDVDCGGAACVACAPGEGCAADGDCVGNTCIANVCAVSCSDGVKNQGESDVDCGGPMCAKCVDGDTCAAASDCASSVCSAGTCQVATCTDGLKSGGETDVDCGGPCGGCANGAACVYAEDCLSGACNSGSCGSWAKELGPVFVPSGVVAHLPGGDFIVAGIHTGTIELGDGPKGPGNTWGGFLARYSPNGTHVWSKIVGSPGSPTALAVDAAGNIVLAASTIGGDYGGGPVPILGNDGGGDIGVFKYSSSGTYLWGKVFGSTQDDPPFAVAILPGGDVVVTGVSAAASIAFGNIVVTSPSPGGANTFLARLAGSDGTPIWAKAFDGFGYALAVNAAGDVFLGGDTWTPPTIDFGCGPLPGMVEDAYVVRFTGAGTCVWSKRWAGPGADYVSGLAVEPSGNLLVTGTFYDAFDFGGGPIGGPVGGNLLVMGLTAAGDHIWSKGFTAAVLGRPSIALDSVGDAVVAGRWAAPSASFGGTVFVNAGGASDAFVAKYAGQDGAHVFSKSIGGPGEDGAFGVSMSPQTHTPSVVGVFQQSVDFGTGPLLADDPYSMFVLSLGTGP